MNNIFTNILAVVGICMLIGVGVGYGLALFEHLYFNDDDDCL